MGQFVTVLVGLVVLAKPDETRDLDEEDPTESSSSDGNTSSNDSLQSPQKSKIHTKFPAKTNTGSSQVVVDRNNDCSLPSADGYASSNVSLPHTHWRDPTAADVAPYSLTSKNLSKDADVSPCPHFRHLDRVASAKKHDKKPKDEKKDMKPQKEHPSENKSPERAKDDRKDQNDEIFEFIHSFIQQRKLCKGEIKFFDAAVVYDRKDFEEVQQFVLEVKFLAEATLLEDVRIELFDSLEFAQSKVMVVEDVIERCSVVFVYLTPNCREETFRLFCDEGIGLTRLGLSGSHDLYREERQWVLKPVHTQPAKYRRYKTPIGLVSLQSIEWYDKESAFTRDRLLHIMELAVKQRKRRELERNGHLPLISEDFKEKSKKTKNVGITDTNARNPSKYLETSGPCTYKSSLTEDNLSLGSQANGGINHYANLHWSGYQPMNESLNGNAQVQNYISYDRTQATEGSAPLPYSTFPQQRLTENSYQYAPQHIYPVQNGISNISFPAAPPQLPPAHPPTQLLGQWSATSRNAMQANMNSFHPSNIYPDRTQTVPAVQSEGFPLSFNRQSNPGFLQGNVGNVLNAAPQNNLRSTQQTDMLSFSTQNNPQRNLHANPDTGFYNQASPLPQSNCGRNGNYMRDQRNDAPPASDLSVVSRVTGKLIVNPDLSTGDIEVDIPSGRGDTDISHSSKRSKNSGQAFTTAVRRSVDHAESSCSDDSDLDLEALNGQSKSSNGKVLNIMGCKNVQLGAGNQVVEKKASTRRKRRSKRRLSSKEDRQSREIDGSTMKNLKLSETYGSEHASCRRRGTNSTVTEDCFEIAPPTRNEYHHVPSGHGAVNTTEGNQVLLGEITCDIYQRRQQNRSPSGLSPGAFEDPKDAKMATNCLDKPGPGQGESTENRHEYNLISPHLHMVSGDHSDCENLAVTDRELFEEGEMHVENYAFEENRPATYCPEINMEKSDTTEIAEIEEKAYNKQASFGFSRFKDTEHQVLINSLRSIHRSYQNNTNVDLD